MEKFTGIADDTIMEERRSAKNKVRHDTSLEEVRTSIIGLLLHDLERISLGIVQSGKEEISSAICNVNRGFAILTRPVPKDGVFQICFVLGRAKRRT